MRFEAEPHHRGEYRALDIDAARPAFDAIGQRDELVRQRIGVMIDRLDDLKSLQDDFSEIMTPLVRISEELSRASVRTAELEALLTQERHAGAANREEASDLVMRLTSVGNVLSEVSSRADQAEAALSERDSAIEELRIALREKTMAVESLDRQMAGETEQNKTLVGEVKSLRAEAQAVDTALARSQHDLLGTRERLAVFDQDNRRLQSLSEEQGGQLADLSARHKELEAAVDLERQRTRALEAQLAAEAQGRERGEAQFEAEVTAHRTERAGLAMKLDSAESRAVSMEQLLTQTRNQLRDKDEAYRAAERNSKESGIARATADRRLESVQADLARQTERLVEMQRLRAELDSRCDMLAKALAAKDAALEQAAARTGALTDRVEHLTGRHEAARAEFEAINRQLMEDLQSERAERALMQGALEIARESRVTLQKQHEALRRSARGWRELPREEEPSEVSDEQSEDFSNVRAFNSSSKPA